MKKRGLVKFKTIIEKTLYYFNKEYGRRGALRSRSRDWLGVGLAVPPGSSAPEARPTRLTRAGWRPRAGWVRPKDARASSGQCSSMSNVLGGPWWDPGHPRKWR